MPEDYTPSRHLDPEYTTDGLPFPEGVKYLEVQFPNSSMQASVQFTSDNSIATLIINRPPETKQVDSLEREVSDSREILHILAGLYEEIYKGENPNKVVFSAGGLGIKVKDLKEAYRILHTDYIENREVRYG